jgi:hypothetical protein
MPMLIQYIDAIARKKGRDVLFVTFPACEPGPLRDRGQRTDYQDCTVRNELITWLDRNGIEWEPCGPFANPNRMVSYWGQLYLDVPYDVNDPVYQNLADHLENPDGTGKIDGIQFCYLPYTRAMDNRHHDEPGFWERWAENF